MQNPIRKGAHAPNQDPNHVIKQPIAGAQCTPQELATILSAFNKIAHAVEPVNRPSDVGFESKLLNEIIFSLPRLRDPMKELLDIVSLKQAREGRKDRMWYDPERYPIIADLDMVCCFQYFRICV